MLEASDDWVADEALCVSCVQDEEHQKMDRLGYFNWDQIEKMCKREKSKVPFSALRNFIRKWHNVDWDRNPWGASI